MDANLPTAQYLAHITDTQHTAVTFTTSKMIHKILFIHRMHLSTIPMTDGHPGAARTFPKIESSLIAPSPQAAASIIGWFSLAPSLPYVEPKSASVNSIGPSSALWSSTAQFCSHTTINPSENNNQVLTTPSLLKEFIPTYPLPWHDFYIIHYVC